MDEILRALTTFPTLAWAFPAGACVLIWLVAQLGVGGDADGNGDAGGEHHGGMWEALGLGNVPLTLAATLVAISGWFTSFTLELFTGGWLRGLAGDGLAAIAFTMLSLLAALFLASRATRLLAPLFIIHSQHGQAHLIGLTATVTSGTVSADFGTATVPAPDGTGPLLLNVIADDGRAYRQGDAVVILDHDPVKNLYRVRSLELPTPASDAEAALRHAAQVDQSTATRPQRPEAPT